MKLVFIIGNAAVGKMTVGQELMKITDLKLFHNHMAIEMCYEIFGYYDSEVVRQLREVIFDRFSESKNEGIIFTYVWAFDLAEDREYICHVADLFQQKGAEIYMVELTAPQNIRLQRNETDNRLKNKPSKRDRAFSVKTLLDLDVKHRTESQKGEIPFKNYMKIDNSEREADVVARMIKDGFGL